MDAHLLTLAVPDSLSWFIAKLGFVLQSKYSEKSRTRIQKVGKKEKRKHFSSLQLYPEYLVQAYLVGNEVRFGIHEAGWTASRNIMRLVFENEGNLQLDPIFRNLSISVQFDLLILDPC